MKTEKNPSIYQGFSQADAEATADIESPVEGKYPFHSKSQLHHMLSIERRRTERSKKPFLLLLLDISGLM